MSKVVKPDKVVEGISDYFASHSDMLIGKPLDLGRLFYVMLHRALLPYDEVTDYEVCWDHVRSRVVAMAEAHGETAFVVIDEEQAVARRERFAVILGQIEVLLGRLGLK